MPDQANRLRDTGTSPCMTFGSARANDGIDLDVAAGQIFQAAWRERVAKNHADEGPVREAPGRCGRIVFRGTELSGHDPKRAIALGIDMVHQQSTSCASWIADRIACISNGSFDGARAWARDGAIHGWKPLCRGRRNVRFQPHTTVGTLSQISLAVAFQTSRVEASLPRMRSRYPIRCGFPTSQGWRCKPK